jgi:hypothetical protein
MLKLQLSLMNWNKKHQNMADHIVIKFLYFIENKPQIYQDSNN